MYFGADAIPVAPVNVACKQKVRPTLLVATGMQISGPAATLAGIGTMFTRHKKAGGALILGGILTFFGGHVLDDIANNMYATCVGAK